MGAHPNRTHKAGLCLQVWEVQNQPLTYLARSCREPGIAHVRSAESQGLPGHTGNLIQCSLWALHVAEVSQPAPCVHSDLEQAAVAADPLCDLLS